LFEGNFAHDGVAGNDSNHGEGGNR
jgi:hypothetical protein